MLDQKRIELAAWEALINVQKQDERFDPRRDIPVAVAAAIAEYDRQQKEDAEA